MAKKRVTEGRIVVTIDTAGQAAPAIRLAAALAKARRRTLHGLFIEDTDLLSVARLPFAREFPRSGGPSREFSGQELERSMARLAERFRGELERQATEASLAWSYASIRTSKRQLTHIKDSEAEFLVIGQPGTERDSRRILLLDGNRPGVIGALEAVLASPQYRNAELMVRGDFDAEALNRVLAAHPDVTRRLMGAPALGELLTNPGFKPSLVLMARDADAGELEPCLRLAGCPVVIAA
jgi:hypothetical protein